MKTEHITIPGKEKISLITNLSTLLGAGISILEAIDSLLEDAKGNQKILLSTLKQDVSQGNRIYTSLAKFPRVFDKVTVNLIKASEEAGTLETTLKDIRKNIKKEMEFNDKIKSALLYPALILVVFFGVLLLMLIVVIPKISTVFSRLKVDLPLPTRFLIFISNLLLNYTIPIIAIIVAGAIGLFFLFKKNRALFIRPFLSLPPVSGLIKEIDLTRLTRSLYLLLSSGITITNALELTEDIAINKNISRAVTNSKSTVSSGKRLSEGLRSPKGVIPSLMIKITEAGERSGALETAMQDLSEHFDYEVSNTLKTITTLLEPLMLIFVSILVGFMMIAIIAPIYGLIGQIGAR